jgi:hypothetical protein
MRPVFFVLILIGFSVGTSVFRCQSPAEKTESAREQSISDEYNIEKINLRLENAMKDSIRQFNDESARMIAVIKDDLASLKLKIERNTINNRTISEKKLAELELSLNELKLKLDGFNDRRIDKWEEFRREFSRDMTELQEALKGIANKNV